MLHAVLEKFFAAVMRGEVTAEKAEEIAGTLFDKCVRENASLSAAAEEPATARALERLRREARTVCRVLFDAEERSAYKPVYVEGYIGGRDIPAPKVSARGAEAELRGRIDRVDACGDKFSSPTTRLTGVRTSPLPTCIRAGRYSSTFICRRLPRAAG